MPAEIPRAATPNIPKPDPLQMRNVEFIVVQTEDGNVFALTPQEYKDLQLNLAEILRYAKEADAQIEFYRRRQNATS